MDKYSNFPDCLINVFYHIFFEKRSKRYLKQLIWVIRLLNFNSKFPIPLSVYVWSVHVCVCGECVCTCAHMHELVCDLFLKKLWNYSFRIFLILDFQILFCLIFYSGPVFSMNDRVYFNSLVRILFRRYYIVPVAFHQKKTNIWLCVFLWC